MLSQEKTKELLEHIEERKFSEAVSCINDFLKKHSEQEVKDFICGQECTLAYKAAHDAFMNEDSENVEPRQDIIKSYIDVTDDYGISILGYAAKKGFLYVVDLLCEIGADVNQRDYRSCTPVILAASENHLDIVEYLLNTGVEIFLFKDGKNKKCECSKSLLHVAATTGNAELAFLCIRIIKHTISNQYDNPKYGTTEYRNSMNRLLNMEIDGKTALDLARDNHSINVVKILEEELKKLNTTKGFVVQDMSIKSVNSSPSPAI